ncbi:hypothetical protein ABEF95_012445 [Exophiala dermatitidis]
MSADDFGVLAIVLPNPPYDSARSPYIVNGTVGFRLQGSIRTLSPNNPENYNPIDGVLYVPELPASSPCDNATRALIPANVTTRADIPEGKSHLIGFAPWTGRECVLSYLSVMRDDGVHGAMFYRPDDIHDSSRPPPVSDPRWSLQDGGQWKTANPFPVYAVPGMLGDLLLDELAKYSGNMSELPHGEELVQMYDPHDTIRLWTRVDIGSSSGIPSLWVFLIIVLAILLTVVLVTSIIMHVIQRKQRSRLQRRVANGEVDLEALGIKRLNVPQDVLDKMPQYIYTSKTEPAAQVNQSQGETSVDQGDNTTSASGATPRPGVREVHFSQPTCPICLDDFVHGETTVRELPCNHIFHPECIDPFLRDNSSLCPMCKKSALPAGYCPVQVTNLMVRRERLIRRTRMRRAPEQQPSTASSGGSVSAPLAALNRRIRRLSMPLASRHRTDPYGSAGGGHIAGSEMHPMQDNEETAARHDDEMPHEVGTQGVAARRAWRRERLARQQTHNYNEQANEARTLDVSRPLWRRVLGRVIPTLE